ncbi:MAG: ABC transporter ATP-binding protein [Kiritimatiellia bacterium]
MSLLELRDVKVWFPIKHGILSRTTGHVRAVDGVTLNVEPGETVGLVGESGCGKTTVARVVLRLVPARAGTIVFDGHNLLNLSQHALREVRRHLQIIFQDPFASLNPRMTTLETVTEGLLTYGLIGRREREAVATALLQDVGMTPDALYRYPHEFSGGQRQRISIARAIALRPRLVICDEAVSALDVSVRAQVLNLLMDLRERHGLAYLFISHDLGAVRHIADRMAVMYLGRIVEFGPTDAVIDAPTHPYTRALISAIPRPDEEKPQRIVLKGEVPSPANPPPGCRFHTRCPFVTPPCREIEPTLELVSGSGRLAHCVACLRRHEI